MNNKELDQWIARNTQRGSDKIKKARVAAIYVRAGRADDLGSVARQQKTLEQFAADKGLVIAGVYADIGASGWGVEQPGRKKLPTDVVLGRFDTVLVMTLDRLAGSRVGFRELDRQLADGGVRIISVPDALTGADDTEQVRTRVEEA